MTNENVNKTRPTLSDPSEWASDLTLSLSPANPHLKWADEFANAGMVHAAIQEYEAALKIDHDDASIRRKLEALRRNPEAIQPSDVRTALSYEEVTEYGLTAKERGRYSVAIAAFAIATKLQPNNAAAWTSLGASYRRAEQPMQALDAYAKSLELGGGGPAQVGLAAVYRDMGEHPAAERLLTEVLEMDPTNAFALNGLGGVYYDLGRNQDAERCFSLALESGGASTARRGLLELLQRYEADGDKDGAQRVAAWLGSLK